MSDFQAIKTSAILMLGVSRDTVHLYIGFLCLLLSLFFVKKLDSYKTLILGLLLSLVLESFDLRDDLSAYGHFRWLASIHDIINTNLLPFIFVIVLKLRMNKKTAE